MPLYPSAAADPAWAGQLHQAIGNGEPEYESQWLGLWGTGVVAVTPTNQTVTVGRVWTYRSAYAITVARLRYYFTASAAGTSNFRFGMYTSAGAQVFTPIGLVGTATADAWHSTALAQTLAADTLYYCVLSATATQTTYSIRASAAPTLYPPLQASTPGNLALAAGDQHFWFGQITVAAGVQPATMPALVRGTGWTGGIPQFYFDANSAA